MRMFGLNCGLHIEPEFSAEAEALTCWVPPCGTYTSFKLV
jgi:hypothetical protein